VFDFPGEVESKPVGKYNLVKSMMKQLSLIVPAPGFGSCIHRRRQISCSTCKISATTDDRETRRRGTGSLLQLHSE